MDNKITGVAGKCIVVNFAFRTRTSVHHFADVGKMVGDGVSAAFTCSPSFVNYITEPTPLFVLQGDL